MKNINFINASKNQYKLLATGMVWGLSAGLAFAAASANDTASNYVGVWGTSPPNNGTGFGNWRFTDGASSTYYSTSLAGISATPIVDNGGNAWALSAESAPFFGYINAYRAFSPGPSGSASLFNQTLSFDLAASGVPNTTPGEVGEFETTIGDLSFGLQEDGLNTPYTYLSDGTSQTTIDPAISLSQWESGLAVSYSVSGPLNSTTENYTLTVSPFSGGAPIYSTSGTFDSTKYAPSGVSFYAYSFVGDGYFNSLNVSAEPVPEPSTIGLLGIGLASLVWRYRK